MVFPFKWNFFGRRFALRTIFNISLDYTKNKFKFFQLIVLFWQWEVKAMLRVCTALKSPWIPFSLEKSFSLYASPSNVLEFSSTLNACSHALWFFLFFRFCLRLWRAIFHLIVNDRAISGIRRIGTPFSQCRKVLCFWLWLQLCR